MIFKYSLLRETNGTKNLSLSVMSTISDSQPILATLSSSMQLCSLDLGFQVQIGPLNLLPQLFVRSKVCSRPFSLIPVTLLESLIHMSLDRVDLWEMQYQFCFGCNATMYWAFFSPSTGRLTQDIHRRQLFAHLALLWISYLVESGGWRILWNFSSISASATSASQGTTCNTWQHRFQASPTVTRKHPCMSYFLLQLIKNIAYQHEPWVRNTRRECIMLCRLCHTECGYEIEMAAKCGWDLLLITGNINSILLFYRYYESL